MDAQIAANPRALHAASLSSYQRAIEEGDTQAAGAFVYPLTLAAQELGASERAKARSLLSTALVAARRQGNPALLLDLLEAHFFSQLQFRTHAFLSEIVEEADPIAASFNDRSRRYWVEMARGMLATSQAQYSLALEWYAKAQTSAPNEFRRVSALLNLARASRGASGSDPHAIEFARRAAQQIELEPYPVLGAKIYGALARAEQGQNRKSTADGLFQRAILLARKGRLEFQLDRWLTEHGALLNQLGRPKEALAQVADVKDDADLPGIAMDKYAVMTRAYALLHDARGLNSLTDMRRAASRANDPPRLIALYLEEATFLYRALGLYKEALESSQELAKVRAGLVESANDRVRTELLAKLDVAVKDRENERLRSEVALKESHGQLLGTALASSGVVIAVVAWLLLSQVKQRRHVMKLSAELSDRNSKLQELHSSRTRMLAAACHDLRQPAHAIGLLIELAIETNATSPGGHDHLQGIRRGSLTLTDMLSELMDLARLETQHYEPVVTAVSVPELMEDVRIQFSEAARRKGLTLETPSDGAAWLVRSDRNLLRRIIFNLVSNAVKYTSSGSVRIGAVQHDTDIVISVEDTGPGIPSEHWQNLFTEYVRLDHSNADGLGIGLAIVKRACDLIGHGLSMTSAVGRGTKISVRLELNTSASPNLGQESDLSQLGWRPFIALLENDKDSQKATGALLRRWGYEVVCAESCADLASRIALDEGRNLDLLITDFHLDSTDGLTEVERIREWTGCELLPALLLTGDLSDEVAVRASAARVAMAYKPLSPLRLRNLLVSVLRSTDRSRRVGLSVNSSVPTESAPVALPR